MSDPPVLLLVSDTNQALSGCLRQAEARRLFRESFKNQVTLSVSFQASSLFRE
ncbi:hypothetical protein PGH44_03465 [Legionella pneumophila]|nr:hypothetical protein PGH44_03465 [Legionella pneumophila]